MMSISHSIEGLSTAALLRHARTAYAASMRNALTRAGYDDIPKNGLYVIGGLALQAKGHRLSELIEELLLSKQAAGQLVDTLVVRGYLVRDVDDEDRRRLKIRLAGRGRAAAKVLANASAAIDAELLALVGPKHLEYTRRTLSALAAIGRRVNVREGELDRVA
jgi:DNA-binding MarR family transcriptional regulator